MKTVAQTVIEADRFYTIAAKGGSVIQAVEKATNGGDIRLGKYEHKPEQEWAFVREGDGVYRIRNRASGKLIDLMMTGTANGTWLHLWEDVGGTSQMWAVEPTPAGTVRLRSSWASGKCIDHSLRYSFHVNPSKFVSFEPIIFVLQVNYTTCCYFLQGFRHFFSTIHKRAPLFSPFCTVCENFSPRFAP